MNKIVVVGLGPGEYKKLTIEAAEKINGGDKVFLRTEKHPIVNYLNKKNIDYISYDYIYEKENNFDDVYRLIVEDLLQNAQKYGIINYCVPGHPLMGDNIVLHLLELMKKGEVQLEIIEGTSILDSTLTAIKYDPLNGLNIIDGLQFSEHDVNINTNNLITHVVDNIIASNIKVKLMDVYGDEQEIYIVKSPSQTGETVKSIKLYELDRLKHYDYSTSIYIPEINNSDKKIYDMNNLLNIMEKLRSKEGCPWDIKQTHISLREYIIEEAYEVVDAIDKEDIDSLIEELGDLLLQVIFQSEIGKEEGYFTIYDVTSQICEKLIYRHPHVFKDNSVEGIHEANLKWNEMKNKKEGYSTYTERLNGVPKAFPALLRGFKVQQKAADVGFDWEDIKDVLSKIEEEYKELLLEFKGGDEGRIEEELGDLLFSIVNLSRFLKINPENSLNRSVEKFITRFNLMEKEGSKTGRDLKNLTLKEMDELWNKIKK